ncbi:MAG: Ig-like domain-containing protein [Bacteroidota bacterium]
MQNVFRKLPYLFLGILLTACANIGAPTGGPQDLRPPQLLLSVPEDQRVNFQGQRIELVFDEWIKVNSITKNLQIAPITDNPYSYEVKKNVLIIEFDKPLLENTTYSLAFGETVGDVTENNLTENLRLAFSTGSQIDSLYLEGRVANLETREAVENAFVAS